MMTVEVERFLWDTDLDMNEAADDAACRFEQVLTTRTDDEELL